jgi:hypothetical protein
VQSLSLQWWAAWQWKPGSSAGLVVGSKWPPDERCDSRLTHRSKRARGTTRNDRHSLPSLSFFQDDPFPLALALRWFGLGFGRPLRPHRGTLRVCWRIGGPRRVCVRVVDVFGFEAEVVKTV